MTTGPEKFYCRISAELDNAINRISNGQNLNRNDTLIYMVDLALANPDHPAKVFPPNNSKSCTMTTYKGFFLTPLAITYRDTHSLSTKKSVFFKNALERAVKIFDDHRNGALPATTP
jgi:hypothetical protein